MIKAGCCKSDKNKAGMLAPPLNPTNATLDALTLMPNTVASKNIHGWLYTMLISPLSFSGLYSVAKKTATNTAMVGGNMTMIPSITGSFNPCSNSCWHTREEGHHRAEPAAENAKKKTYAQSLSNWETSKIKKCNNNHNIFSPKKIRTRTETRTIQFPPTLHLSP